VQRASLVLACSLALSAGTPAAQPRTIDDLMFRVGDYVHRFVDRFSNVVAEEEYERNKVLTRGQVERIRSDYLLVRHPGGARSWLTFRDVLSVNGRAVDNHQERIIKLFVQPFESAIQQANAITRYGARYISPLSDPLLGIAFLQHQYQPHFRYTLGDRDDRVGLGVRRIKFEETIVPTILRGDGNRDLPTRGTAWVVEQNGRVVRTELEVGSARSIPIVTTTFTFDDTLQIDVPATMQDSVVSRSSTLNRGVAYYSHFRRFTVRTEERIDAPRDSSRR
jgi:hypothetical protein